MISNHKDQIHRTQEGQPREDRSRRARRERAHRAVRPRQARARGHGWRSGAMSWGFHGKYWDFYHHLYDLLGCCRFVDGNLSGGIYKEHQY